MLPWPVYQVLGDRGLNLVPWAKYEAAYQELGVEILNKPRSYFDGAPEVDTDKIDDGELEEAAYGSRTEYGF